MFNYCKQSKSWYEYFFGSAPVVADSWPIRFQIFPCSILKPQKSKLFKEDDQCTIAQQHKEFKDFMHILRRQITQTGFPDDIII